MEEKQHEIAQKSQRGHYVWISRTGFIFQKARVITPVISDFTTTPMIADMLKPLFRGPSIHMREALLHGIHSKHRNGTTVHPDVGLFNLLKKGERCSVFSSAFFCEAMAIP